MATKLNKPVTRKVTIADVNGVEGEVDVTMTGSGIVFSSGRRKLGVVPWTHVVKGATPPGNMPGAFMNNYLGWLVELSNK
jgi:hypothetical protein